MYFDSFHRITELNTFLLLRAHLHEMSPYKLRKWAICMIWANNSEFSFFAKFDALKPRITISSPEMGSTSQH